MKSELEIRNKIAELKNLSGFANAIGLAYLKWVLESSKKEGEEKHETR